MPTTRAPRSFASWPAIWPTPPEAAETTAVSPAFGRALQDHAGVGGQAQHPQHADGLGNPPHGRVELARDHVAGTRDALAHQAVIRPAVGVEDEVAGGQALDVALHHLGHGARVAGRARPVRRGGACSPTGRDRGRRRSSASGPGPVPATGSAPRAGRRCPLQATRARACRTGSSIGSSKSPPARRTSMLAIEALQAAFAASAIAASTSAL